MRRLQGREGPAGVAVARLGEELECVVVQVHLEMAQTADRIGRGTAQQRLDLLGRKRLELEDAAAAHQGAIDREERILGRGPDQNDLPLLHAGQEHVLLRLVETMDLVDEQQSSLAGGREPIEGLGQHFAKLFDAAGHGAELLEVTAAFLGQEPGQSGFSAAGRAKKNHRPKPVRLQ